MIIISPLFLQVNKKCLLLPSFHLIAFLGFHQIVLLFPLYCHKFSKTLLTNSTHGGIFPVNPTDLVDWFETIYKLWSCSFWTQPQKVVGYHRETHHFSEGKSAKEFTAPQHTRSILPPIHPTKSSLRCMGGIFLQIEPYVVVQFPEIRFRLLVEQP